MARPKRTLKQLRPDEANEIVLMAFKLNPRPIMSRRFDKFGREGDYWVAIYQGEKIKLDKKFAYTPIMLKFFEQQNIDTTA